MLMLHSAAYLRCLPVPESRTATGAANGQRVSEAACPPGQPAGVPGPHRICERSKSATLVGDCSDCRTPDASPLPSAGIKPTAISCNRAQSSLKSCMKMLRRQEGKHGAAAVRCGGGVGTAARTKGRNARAGCKEASDWPDYN
jgi:hypothetical protein